MKHLVFLALVPSFALANEAQLGCNLERSKAEVGARIAEAPVAYGSANDTTDKSVTVGIAQSLRGRTQAGLIREAAEARCDAIRASTELENHARFTTAHVQKRGAITELRDIEAAITLAKSHIAQLDAQLTAQTITITEHTAARQVLVGLEQRQADLLRIISRVTVPVTPELLPNLIERARSAEARAAGLAAQAQAETGWDVRPTVGARQSLNGGSASAFVGLSFTYSFGYSGAKDAARDVQRQTETYLAAQGGGFTQTLLRQQAEVKALIEAETLAASTSARQVRHLEQVLASLDGIDTALANNTRRALQIQVLVLQAEARGATERGVALRHLLEQLT